MPETTATERDARHLQRAIELATRARGQTSPNPIVGAVVVKDERVIGEGITQPPGEAARRGAWRSKPPLRNPPGATLYVSLEPCCHEGRTPPCTDAILERRDRARRDRVRRPDPEGRGPRPGNPSRRGRATSTSWTARSRDAARLLNQPFRKHARTGRPLVVFKSAMTLDGKVATAHRRLPVDLRRGEPRTCAPLARRV